MTQSASLRRQFLRFLAASPLSLWAQHGSKQTADVADALNVMDLEPLARQALPPAHWGYLSTGVDDDLTLRRNREAMDHYQVRARALTAVVSPDLRTDVFGESWDLPVYLSAVGHQRQFHPDGELAAARAARQQKVRLMLSTVTGASVEEVARDHGGAPWYQLYMPHTWAETEKMVKRVEAAGCTVLVWTIDTLAGRNTETSVRLARTDLRDCMTCHRVHPLRGNSAERNRFKPMFAGLSGNMNPPGADWSYVDRLKKMTSMKLLLKGIDTADDAVLAREHGADGVIVSNHGGRAAETGRGTIDILQEVIPAVEDKFPVLVDGGFRRGSDVFKALALGARAVGIGRPYIWGLAAFGQPGVERVLQILRAELSLTMRQCGTASIPQISHGTILRNGQRV
jgi:isopentenyl diphosphate isomerase/L-lactate dehydrogenase-like FMN-dependent dehydrogenase